MGMANHHGCSYPLMSIMIYSITIINPVYFSFL
ncbi:unknown [Prevotella sp. CAG:279]|nr:unknown [Prevotella sp. CAG:279]